MKTVKARYALLIAVGLLMAGLLGNVMAANYNWDGGTATGYQSTNGTWETSAFWTLNGTTLTTWPGASTNNAYFAGSSTTVTNFVSVGSSVSVNQLGLGWNGSVKEDNCFVTLTNGTITIGAGGIIVNSAKTVLLYSDVILATNQTWDVRTVALPVYGSIKDGGSGYGITKIGANQLTLTGSNTFSGGVTLNAGTLMVGNAWTLGTGPLTINGGTIDNLGYLTNLQNNAQFWNGSFTYGGTAQNFGMGTGSVTLGTNVTVTANGSYTLSVGAIDGSYGLTKVGVNSTLGLTNPNGNTYTGLTTVVSGVLKSMATNGVSFGSGSLLSMNMGTASTYDAFLVSPAGSGGTANVLGGTNGNNTITFDGISRFGLAKGSWTSVNFTFGTASDTGSAFVRSGRSALGLTGSSGSASIANDGKFLLAATNSFNTPYINPANGVVDPYLFMQGVGSQWPVDLMKYNPTAGFANVTWTTMPASGTNDSLGLYYINVSSANSILPASSSVYAYRIGWSAVTNIFNSGVTLTIGDGSRPAGLLFTASGGVVMTNAAGAANTKIDFRGSEGIILSGAYDNSIYIPIHGSNGLTIANAGGNNNKALTLGAANAYSGATTVMGGKLQVGSGSTSGDLGNSDSLVIYAGASAVFNRSDSYNFSGTVTGVNGGTFTRNAGTGALTLNNLTGGITLTDNSTTGSTMPTTVNQSGTNAIGTINGASGSVVILQGTGTTSIANGLNTAGQTVKFNGGTWDLNADGGFASSLEVNDGTVNKPAPSRNFYNLGSFVMHGGLLISLNGYGMRMGSTFGASNTGGNKFTGFQDGGLVSVSGEDVPLGSAAVNLTNSYTLAGGTFNAANGRGFIIGAAITGAGFTQLVLTNSGKLLVSGTLQGAQGAGAKQIFDFAGGTLAANAVDATKLSSAAAPSVQGTLVNNGGAMAPGDIGTPGKTTITGSYSNAPSAVLAIDIGGTKQGTAFTNAPDYYDTVSVSVGAALNGKLSVSLINGYVPIATNKFTVLTSTGLSGAFVNVSAGKVWTSDGYSRFDVLTNATANAVVLSNYVVNAWSPTSGNAWTTGANWSLAEANGSGMAAYFGAGASGSVILDTARTVRGLTFNNGSASYTLSGSASLTLQGDTLTTPKLSVTAGSHTISVPIVLSNATEIAVAPSSMLTLAGNVTGAQAVTKTGTGTLALSGVNTLGSLTVSAGKVQFVVGATTVSALTIASGATCDFFAGTLYILKNGGGTDTMEKVNTAITANSITLRGKNALPIDFKVTEETINSVVYVKVTAKLKGTMITVM